MSRDFLSSAEGRWLLYHTRRWRRRITLDIRGIEPRSKKSMPEDSKVALQREVIEQLKKKGRGPFRGPLMLSISLSTTHRTPSHAPSIAKNLLDLLGKPLTAVRTSRTAVLYRDDRNIDGLSVMCRHGQSSPRIVLTAVPFGAFLQDLGLALSALDYSDLVGPRHPWHEERGQQSMNLLRDLRRNEGAWRRNRGDQTYERFIATARKEAQRWLLRQTPVSFIVELAYLYGAHGNQLELGRLPLASSSDQVKFLGAHPFRIILPELPQTAGTSRDYIRRVEQQIRAFRDRFEWILSPLKIPIALQAIVKPPPPERATGMNDLDNVLRNYLIPRTVELFEPPYEPSLYDVNEVRAGTFAEVLRGPVMGTRSTVPASARVGLTRYEAWRVPRAAGDLSPGYIAVSVVADQLMGTDLLSQIDSAIDRAWPD